MRSSLLRDRNPADSSASVDGVDLAGSGSSGLETSSGCCSAVAGLAAAVVLEGPFAFASGIISDIVFAGLAAAVVLAGPFVFAAGVACAGVCGYVGTVSFHIAQCMNVVRNGEI